MADGIDISAVTNSSFFSSLFLSQREKLDNINTIEQCVDLLYNSKNIIVLTGAGCSVSCGIPDFRSRDGVYARLRVDFPDLPDPQAMFDIHYFQHDPRPFFKFAKEIYPGQFKPSLSHLFVRKIEEHGKLLRNYTQNIDTLEMAAQIKNVIQCHGSFATATCTVCKYKVDSEFIREQIFNQDIPYCFKCKEIQDSKATTTEEPTNQSSDDDEDFMPKFENSGVGILKPDIVFFGEGLPDHYHRSIELDKTNCDLLIVIGSSLKVKPVANIPHLLKSDVPQILINRESLKHLNFDIELLGDCDVIVNELLMRLEERRLNDKINPNQLEWNSICVNKQRLNMIDNDESEKMFFSSENKPNEPLKEVFNYNERYTLDYLKENSFLHLKPNMYVFHGAELSIRSTKKKLRGLRKRMNLVELDDFASDNSNDSESAGKIMKRSLLDNEEEEDEEEFDSDEFTSSEDDSEDDDDDEEDSSQSSSDDQQDNHDNKNNIEVSNNYLNEANQRPNNDENNLQDNS
jgi:NAD-dependent SIR2 family protein deacetylase